MIRRFIQLGSAEIGQGRGAIISKAPGCGYTIAQTIMAQGDQKPMKIYLKGAFHIDDLDSLKALRNMLDDAIFKEENEI